MSDQFNEMEYSSVDGGMQDVDMLDVDSEQPMQDGPSPCTGREGQCFQSSRINIAPSEGRVDHAGASSITEHSFLVVIRLLTTVGCEKHVPQVLGFLKDAGVTHHLEVANRCLKLDANKPSLNNRRFPDREGDELMSQSLEHKKVLGLLCDAHGFLSSDESYPVEIRPREYNNALYHLQLAQDLVSRWLSQ